MKLLIVYDVSTIDKAGAKRLRQVAQCCKDYGQRVHVLLTYSLRTLRLEVVEEWSSG